jgi:hypothetical protein
MKHLASLGKENEFQVQDMAVIHPLAPIYIKSLGTGERINYPYIQLEIRYRPTKGVF